MLSLFAVDSPYKIEESIVLRYHALNQLGLTEDDIHKVSFYKNGIAEGVRILPFMNYKGVEIDLLDESSLMSSGTMKTIDGCLAIAKCLKEGMNKIVIPSGANTGAAYSLYGKKAGIETFFFIPSENIQNLNGNLFTEYYTHLIAIEDINVVKSAAVKFADLLNNYYMLPYRSLVPNLNWRIEASRFRGYAIAELINENNKDYHWLAQSICGGFGPVGIYDILLELYKNKQLISLPRFLGVQQIYNSILYDMWKGTSITNPDASRINAVMYDKSPQNYNNFNFLLEILDQTNGDILILSKSSYHKMLDNFEIDIIDLLESKDIHINFSKDGKPIEVAGLMSIFGALEAINQGLIKKETSILVSFSGGDNKLFNNTIVTPEFQISKTDNLDQALNFYLNCLTR